jgi:DNA-binding NarL/FixJ family response regulator
MNTIKSTIIIDDDPVFSFIIAQHLKFIDPAHSVFCFQKAWEGHSFLEQNPLKGMALVLMDLNMPGIHEWELVGAVCGLSAKLRSHLQLYVVTNSVAISDIEKVKEFPAVKKLLLKPLEQKLLKKLLDPTEDQLGLRMGF